MTQTIRPYALVLFWENAADEDPSTLYVFYWNKFYFLEDPCRLITLS